MATFTASQKVPSTTGGPSGGPYPWVDPWMLAAAENAAHAGQILAAAMAQSRAANAGIKGWT